MSSAATSTVVVIGPTFLALSVPAKLGSNALITWRGRRRSRKFQQRRSFRGSALVEAWTTVLRPASQLEQLRALSSG